MIKALEILYTLISSGNDDVFANKNTYEKLTLIAEAIDELEELKNRKCQNCKYEKLSKERYLAHHQCLKLVSSVDYGFCCNKWESK